ncbi:MAG: SDR family NAD(P)-dependent oxidoreductase [Candidatus Izemoplasmatales bacterium]
MNKTVVISGASSGIGFATANFLQSKGYNVIGLSRKYPIEQYKFKYLLCDITKETDVVNCCNEINKLFDNVEVLINCAGMGVSGALEYSSLEEGKRIFDVNVFGQFLLTKNMLPLLRKAKSPRIINIGSVAGILTIPFQTFYSMTKAAITSFSEGLRIELAPFNIQVSTVHPGDIQTGFTKNREMPKTIENSLYNERIKVSIERMARDEENGMSALSVSKVIFKLIRKKRMPIAKTVGFQYKVFVLLNRLLPKKLVSYVIKKMYG